MVYFLDDLVPLKLPELLNGPFIILSEWCGAKFNEFELHRSTTNSRLKFKVK